ncbi:DUF1501 domain-containing protein [Verrucomicrobia bacterium]|nr:DUF1501 domain-containing protein [Verrucomicrobiota bacterium]MDC0218546.1 DUF1501 domain-containing protein [Verrucomicrobiota bacterium]
MAHCGNFDQPPLTRRDMLARCANGFGGIAMASMLASEAMAKPANPLAPKPPHFAPKAKSIIFLYMDGGPASMDTFDPKPRLTKENGKPFGLKMEATQFNSRGKTLGSPWNFKNYGQAGIPISDLFPHVAKHADKLCVIRSMTSNFSEHTNGNYFLHTGFGQVGRPSMGSWINYGLGTTNQNLPGFIVLNGGLIPPGGLGCFSNGFLPAAYQASVFKYGDKPIANIARTERSPELQQNKLKLLRMLDQGVVERMGRLDQIESAITNHELAYRMQSAVPELMDIKGETEATKQLYGLDASFKNTATFSRNCLIARRLVERGVRFIELTCPGGNGDRWDQHGGLKEGHTKNAKSVDQGIAALLEDLEARGLLDSTLLVWMGEFGRTPFAQGNNGRDHNPFGFSLWMAGGGVKGGMTYGATDEYGYKAVDKKLEIHDLHATMLHLLGMDHTKLTLRFSSRDMRLTDVHGEVIKDILA